jgi:serine/threonine protein kinase/tetratricopeptide (TPR) repeat protein
MHSPQQNEKALFSAARELTDPAQCRAFLDQACAGNPEMRRRLEEMLTAQTAAQDFFGEATIKSDVPLSGYLPFSEKPGDRIGRYKLLERIGEGGCGVVYVAEQEEPVRRRVALKVIKLGMDTRSVVARFEAERQALAMMDHPNIAKVLDAGATETGRPYFVMELVRGIIITQYCDENKLTARERLDLFIKVCQAVQHAHQKGIIHRDLKPSNILVTLHDGVPVPKVIDFGIAKATEGRLTDLTVYTELRQFIGTPAYMSPEQAEMSGLDIDTRSDIYSLGVLLYELLTGCTPFDAKELVASGLEAMRRTIREKEPLRPSTRLNTLSGEQLTTTAQRRGVEAPKLIHQVQGDLDWIAMKCLEKDRTRRYETANGLAADLKRFLGNEAIVARPPSTTYRLRKAFRRNRATAVAAGLVLLTLLLGVALTTSEAVREHRAEREQSRLRERAEASEAKESRLREQAVMNEKLARSEAVRSKQIASFLKGMLAEVKDSVALGRDTAVVKDILDRTTERVARDLRDQPEVDAELREIMGDTYGALYLLPQAQAMHREALRLRIAALGTNDLEVADSLEKLSASLSGAFLPGDSSDPAQAEELLKQALAIRERLSGDKDPSVVRCLNGLGYFRYQKGDLAGAQELLDRALEIGKRVLNAESPELAESLNRLGDVLADRGDLIGAEAALIESLRLKRKLFGDASLPVVDAAGSLAGCRQFRGDMEGAEKLFLECLAVSKRLCGDTNPMTEANRYFLTRLYASWGREHDAELGWRKLLTAPGWGGNLAPEVARNSLEELFMRASLIKLAPDSEREPILWRYTFSTPSTNWVQIGFDDQDWRNGYGLFGSPAYQSRTGWDLPVTNIWLRRSFDLNEATATAIVFRVKCDSGVEIFLDGVDAAKLWRSTGTSGAYWLLPCSPLAQTELRPGRNEIAIHAWGPPYSHCVDVGVYAAPHWRDERLRFVGVLEEELRLQPTNTDLLQSHSDLLAQCAEWGRVAADLNKLIELQPTNQWFYHLLAPVLAYSGDTSGYEHLRKQILTHFCGTKDPLVAERMAQSCLLMPLSGPDLDSAVRLADTAASADRKHSAWIWFQFVKGLADYRQGRFSEAAQCMQENLENKEENWNRRVLAYMVLAMSQHQLKQTSQARTTLVAGIDLARKRLPGIESGALGPNFQKPNFQNSIVVYVLIREAQALIAGEAGAETEALK